MQITNSTNLPQIAFCNMVFTDRKVMVLYVCVLGQGYLERKVLCRLLRRTLRNFTTDGDGSHPTCRHVQIHSQQRPCEFDRSNSFYKVAKLQ